MTTLYCPECGYKNEYTLHPPSFCGGCGIRLGDSPPSKTRKKKIRRSESAKEDDSDETDIYHVPDISKLDIDISYEGQARVFRGSDLANIPKEDLGGRSST